MTKVRKNQLTVRLNELNIEKIAISSGFTKRSDSKISLLSFLQSFMESFMEGSFSLSSWASALGMLIGTTVTKQALQGKFHDRQTNTLKAVLQATLEQKVQTEVQKEAFSARKWALFAHFGRVLLEDSTCQKVHECLHEAFPTSSDGKGSVSATLRIQTIFELVSNTFVFFNLESYRDNDQKAARNVLGILKKGDLVIRDLGYLIIDVLRQVMDKEAYFLSLCKPGISVFDATTKEQILLVKYLRKISGNAVDMKVEFGAKDRLPVRLVALRLPDEVANEKRRKVRLNAHRTSNHSDEYYELLGWNIFITNVSTEIWSFEQISYAYRVRWRIETTYKCWKSVFNFKTFFTGRKMLLERVRICTYIILTLYAIIFDTMFTYFAAAVQAHHKTIKTHHKRTKNPTESPVLSMLKAGNLIKQFFYQLVHSADWSDLIPTFYKHGTYEERSDRPHFEYFTHNIF